MNPTYLEQAQRLQHFRQSLDTQGHPDGGAAGEVGSNALSAMRRPTAENDRYGGQPVKDPLIYAGLYAPSGIDMMSILIQVRMRKNPTFDLGSIDDSAALVLCDAENHEMPIVYCSEPFEKLTGYSQFEIMGQNCRFLQYPYDGSKRDPADSTVNEAARKVLRAAVNMGQEGRAKFVNYRKDGSRFENILTVIPISLEDGGVAKKYYVGFQVNADQAW